MHIVMRMKMSRSTQPPPSLPVLLIVHPLGAEGSATGGHLQRP
jgi:hypothetical protein